MNLNFRTVNEYPDLLLKKWLLEVIQADRAILMDERALEILHEELCKFTFPRSTSTF